MWVNMLHKQTQTVIYLAFSLISYLITILRLPHLVSVQVDVLRGGSANAAVLTNKKDADSPGTCN